MSDNSTNILNQPLSEILASEERIREVVKKAAEESTKRLVKLGFPAGFSAKMVLADVNIILEEEGVTPLNLKRFKLFLLGLGYTPSEAAYQPYLKATYSAWTKSNSTATPQSGLSKEQTC